MADRACSTCQDEGILDNGLRCYTCGGYSYQKVPRACATCKAPVQRDDSAYCDLHRSPAQARRHRRDDLDLPDRVRTLQVEGHTGA